MLEQGKCNESGNKSAAVQTSQS